MEFHPFLTLYDTIFELLVHPLDILNLYFRLSDYVNSCNEIDDYKNLFTFFIIYGDYKQSNMLLYVSI